MLASVRNVLTCHSNHAKIHPKTISKETAPLSVFFLYMLEKKALPFALSHQPCAHNRDAEHKTTTAQRDYKHTYK